MAQFSIKIKNKTGKSTYGIGEAEEYVASPKGDGQVIIDLLKGDSYKFTASPLTPYLTNTIPYVILFEYDLDFSSYIAQLLYYYKLYNAGSQQIGSVINNTAVGNKVSTYVEDLFKKIPSVDKVIDGIKGKAADYANNNKIVQAIGDFNASVLNNSEFGNNKAMAPYGNLYLRKKTQFTYILPYFEDKKRSIANTFSQEDASLVGKSDIAQAVFSGGILGKAGSLAENIAGAFHATSPGAFLERPKFYDYGTTGDAYTVTFDLINTIDNLYQSHYDFLNLITFQNLPYRLSLANVRPPKIYRCVIPGEQDIPYCYISAINISYIGNRRILKVESTFDGVGSLDAIIPDVYRVSLTLTGLVNPTGNFMRNLSNKVRVQMPTGPLQPITTPPTVGSTIV